MRCMPLCTLLLVTACRGDHASPTDPPPVSAPQAAPAAAPRVARPPDDMDEKMRHCPLAIDGGTATLTEIADGVQFDLKVPPASVDEAHRRAHHIVEFAAGRHATDGTHGAFDGKGGGRMKNCPVVTTDVTIAVEDLDDGARIKVTTHGDRVAALRDESRERAAHFPYPGATVVVR